MARRSRKNVGIIGLGIIGSRVARVLRDAGFQVYVWSRTPRPEPNFMGSPAQIAEICEVIQIFVSNADAVFETVERLSGSLTSRHVVVCNATIGPEATLEAARRVREQGAQFVDAPFTGSLEAAEQRALVYYLGGEDDVLARVEPVLQASSKALVRIGEVGEAATVKLATNMMVAVTVQTLAEAMALAERQGVSAERFADALASHGVHSGLTAMKLPKMMARDFTPHFSLKHMFKDVQLAIHLANGMNLEIPATTATAGVIYGGLNRGWGEQDLSIVSEVYAELMEPTAEQAPASPPAPPETKETEPAEPVAEEAAEAVEDLETQPADMTVEVTQGPVDFPAEAPDKKPASEAAERKEKEAEPEASIDPPVAPGEMAPAENVAEPAGPKPEGSKEPENEQKPPEKGSNGIFKILFGSRS